MASSDERASKCVKNGVSFRETYPEDFAQYEAANTKYNENEQKLAELEAQRGEQSRAPTLHPPGQMERQELQGYVAPRTAPER